MFDIAIDGVEFEVQAHVKPRIERNASRADIIAQTNFLKQMFADNRAEDFAAIAFHMSRVGDARADLMFRRAMEAAGRQALPDGDIYWHIRQRALQAGNAAIASEAKAVAERQTLGSQNPLEATPLDEQIEVARAMPPGRKKYERLMLVARSFQKTRPAHAAGLIEEALAAIEDPGDFDTWLSLRGVVITELLRVGAPDAARQHFRGVSDAIQARSPLGPTYANYLLGLETLIAAWAGETARIRERFQRLPANIAWQALGEAAGILAWQGDFTRLRQIAELAPNGDPTLVFRKALGEAAWRDLDFPFKEAVAALGAEPADNELRIAAVNTSAANVTIADKLWIAQSITKLEPQLRALYFIAQQAARQGDAETVIQITEIVEREYMKLDDDEARTRILLNIAQTNYWVGRYSEARRIVIPIAQQMAGGPKIRNRDRGRFDLSEAKLYYMLALIAADIDYDRPYD